ncbi:hypothetical protein MNV49_005809 [Pseudohyphozyma bogoriensis]|nr:hypothetical protein MNV49_005809 [Pseudohyphozyma bogoriensis]
MRLRGAAGLLLLGLTSLPTTLASSKVFYASAVSYCSEARSIVVSKFLLEYNAAEKSISFDISAEQANPNLDASLEFQLEAYGINAVNVSFNLCDELGGVLCPLPTYDFVGSATIPLPSSVTDKIKLPGIAFVIPDLQATAYVRLVSVETGDEAACLKVDLSNGLTTRHTYVTWALVAIVLLSIAVSVLGGLINLVKGYPVELGRRKERLVHIFSWYHFVVLSGILSLDYPIVFSSFVANFAWSVGLVSEKPIQQGIDDLRQRTGGNLTQLAGNLVGGTEALTQRSVERALGERAWEDMLASATTSLVKRVSSNYEVPTVSENDTVNAVAQGIPHYLTNLNISPYNGFMTVFIQFLFLLCIFIALVLVLAIPFFVVERIARRREWEKRLSRGGAGSLVRANALRVLLIAWPPLLTFTFFQWTLGKSDSWAPIVLSVFTIIFTTASLLFLSLRLFLIIRRNSRSSLLALAGPYAPFWNQFRESRWWFYLPTLLVVFIDTFFVVFAHGHSWRQTIGLVIVEGLFFISQCVFTPYTKKTTNGIHITLQILRLVILGCLMALDSSWNMNEIVRVAISIVIAVIESVVVVGFFLLVLIDLVAVVLRVFRKAPQPDPIILDSRPMTEAGTTAVGTGTGGLRTSRSDSPTLHEEASESGGAAVGAGKNGVEKQETSPV